MRINPLISIIVPVYNVEKYLGKCVDSLLSQSYGNIEIILVDDGSPDNCGHMCDRFAERDCRIKVVHKKNGGLSDARNAGLEIASGDFITYVDADDYVSENLLKTLNPPPTNMERFKNQIVSQGFNKKDDNNFNNKGGNNNKFGQGLMEDNEDSEDVSNKTVSKNLNKNEGLVGKYFQKINKASKTSFNFGSS